MSPQFPPLGIYPITAIGLPAINPSEVARLWTWLVKLWYPQLNQQGIHIDSRLRPRCAINSQWVYPTSGRYRWAKFGWNGISAVITLVAFYRRLEIHTTRHRWPLRNATSSTNRKCITYCNAAKGGLSHGQNRCRLVVPYGFRVSLCQRKINNEDKTRRTSSG